MPPDGKVISYPQTLALLLHSLANPSDGAANLTSSQGVLGILSHGVGFVQDHKLKPFLEDCPCAGKAEDWPPNNIDPSVVRSIQLQDHGAKFFIFVQLLGTGQDGGCLSCPWRAIEK